MKTREQVWNSLDMTGADENDDDDDEIGLILSCSTFLGLKAMSNVYSKLYDELEDEFK